MNKIQATGANCGSMKTLDYLSDNQRLLGLDYAEKTGDLQSFLLSQVSRNQKAIRLYKCFCCDRNTTARKMSNCLVICRDCYHTVSVKGLRAKTNLIAKTLNNIHKFLRRRVEI